MISEFLLNILFSIVTGIFSVLPEITWDTSTSAAEFINGFISVASYMLPMGTVRSIVRLIISITLFKFIWGIPKALWDALPIA